MEALRAPLRELGEFEEIQGKLKKREPLCLGMSVSRIIASSRSDEP